MADKDRSRCRVCGHVHPHAYSSWIGASIPEWNDTCLAYAFIRGQFSGVAKAASAAEELAQKMDDTIRQVHNGIIATPMVYELEIKSRQLRDFARHCRKRLEDYDERT